MSCFIIIIYNNNNNFYLTFILPSQRANARLGNPLQTDRLVLKAPEQVLKACELLWLFENVNMSMPLNKPKIHKNQRQMITFPAHFYPK